MPAKSLCLVSGGLDSCVALACAREDTEVKLCLSVYYGQKHARELFSAQAIADFYGIERIEINLGDLGNHLSRLHSTALVDPEEQLPSGRRMSEMTAHVPRSYVPGRNTIMLALAQSIAESCGADHIYTGFNAVDFSGYPDCRPIFVNAWNSLASYATKRGYEGNPITCVAPIINLSKASVVRRGRELGAPLELTWSCYNGGQKACGSCDSCIIRYNAFKEVDDSDPLEYDQIPYRSVL